MAKRQKHAQLKQAQRTKMSRRLGRARRVNAAILVWLQITLLVAAPAFAGPRGERVIRGEASFTREHSGSQNRRRRNRPRITRAARRPVLNLTTITASDGAVIEYLGGFNILAHEIVRFVQPDSSSVVTNIDRSANATLIQGTLIANGMVILINRYGVFIDNTAVINAAHFLAAAGEVSADGGFRAPLKYELYGEVVNRGSIRADSVTLLGRRVANHGQIVAEAGSVLLAAGDDVWISQLGSPVLVQLSRAPDGPSPAGPLLENSGEIDAGRQRIRLAAGDALGVAIRNTGALRAGLIQLEGGETGTLHISGQLDARNRGEANHGGVIQVTGENVALLGASLDASGDAGGGVIHVGGERHGEGELRQADQVFVNGNSELRADALVSGDGGEVIVWSETQSRVYGAISARGGELGGDGGFVETSSRLRLVALRAPDVSAKMGVAGEWLIDPVNIEIKNGEDPECSSNIVPFCNPDPDDPIFDTGDFGSLNPIFQANSDEFNPSIVSADAISEALGRGGVVTITTSMAFNDEEKIGDQAGTITILDDIIIDSSSEAATAFLRLSAADSIYVGLRVDDDGNYILRENGPVSIRNDAVDRDGIDDLRFAVRMVANESGVAVYPQPELGDQNPLTNPAFYEGDVIVNGHIATNSSIPAGQISGNNLEDVNLELVGVRVEILEGSSLQTKTGSIKLVGNSLFYDVDFREDRPDLPFDTAPEISMLGTIDSQGAGVRLFSPGNVTVGAPSASGTVITTDGGTLTIESQLQSESLEEGTDLRLTHIQGGLYTGSGDLFVLGDRITIDAPLTTDGAVLAGGLGTGPISLTVGLGDLAINDHITTRGGDFIVTSPSRADSLPEGDEEFDRRVTIAQDVLIDTRPNDVIPDGGAGGIFGVQIDGTLLLNGSVRTGGGAVLLAADRGSMELNGTINAVRDALDSQGQPVAGNVEVNVSGDVRISGDIRGNALILRAGNAGKGDLLFGQPFNVVDVLDALRNGLPTGVKAPVLEAVGRDPEAGATGILLQAGNPNIGGSSSVNARSGQPQFVGASVEGENSLQFQILQDESIIPAQLPDLSQFTQDAVDLDYTVRSLGEVRLSKRNVDDTTLRVEASAFTVDSSGIDVNTLEVVLSESFVLDEALADRLSAQEIRIRSAGDLSVDDNVTLVAGRGEDEAGTIELASGTSGTGDLSFGGDVTLVSDHVALRAGISTALPGVTHGAKIVLDGRIRVEDIPQGALPQFHENQAETASARSFEFVQNADIDDTQLPFAFVAKGDDDFGQFGDLGIAGMKIDVRSTNGTIDIGADIDVADEDPNDWIFNDADLSLLAKNDVTLHVDINIRELEVGGTESFTVTQALIDQIKFSEYARDTVNGLGSRLTLRAGADPTSPIVSSVLSFESSVEDELRISADRITLFAGGPSGGDAVIDVNSKLGLLFSGVDDEGAPDPTKSPDTFVFRQQRGIGDDSLPRSDQFASTDPDTLGPNTYAVRSDADDGFINLQQLDLVVGHEGSQIILSAAEVNLGADGVDLSFDGRHVQIRSDAITLLASGIVEPEPPPVTDPPTVPPTAPPVYARVDASALGLCGSEPCGPDDERASGLRAFDLGRESEDFDLDQQGTELPESFTITQAGDIKGADLPLAEAFMGASPGDIGPVGVRYMLESDLGDIDLQQDFERTNGSALVLRLNSSDHQIDLGSDHKLKSLQASTDGTWRLNNNVQVDAEEYIILAAGCADQSNVDNCSGRGDLLLDSRETGGRPIRLRANVIDLRAGLELVADDPDPSKVVMNSENLSFELTRPLTVEPTGSFLTELAQLGRGQLITCLISPKSCFLAEQAAPLDSLELPIAGAFRKSGDDRSQSLGEIDLLQLLSFSGESRIDKLANIRARNLEITAFALRLEDPTFSEDPDFRLGDDSLLSNTTIVADRVTVEATNGFVPGNDPSFILSNFDGGAPSRFELIQTVKVEAKHLPSPEAGQFTPTGIGERFIPGFGRVEPMVYSIVSKGVTNTDGTIDDGNIDANADFAALVEESQLELQAGEGGTVELSGSRSFLLESFKANLSGDVEDTSVILNVTGPEFTINSADNQEFGSPVMLKADTSLKTGPSRSNSRLGGIFFGDTVTSDARSNLTARATTVIAFAKDVGVDAADPDSDASALGNLELIGLAAGSAFVFGEIPEIDELTGVVTTPASDAPVRVKTVASADPKTGRLLEGDIIFRVDIIDSDDDGRTDPFPIASILKFSGAEESDFGERDEDSGDPVYKDEDADLFFDAGRNFIMEEHEKLAVPGGVKIRAVESATLADISALVIRVEAPIIDLQLRKAGFVLRQDGSIHQDGGFDLVANEISFVRDKDSVDGAKVTWSGSGAAPLFGLPNPLELPDFFDGKPIFPTAQARDDGMKLTPSDFFLDPQTRTLLDKQAEGATLADVSEAFWIRPPQPTAYLPVIGVVADPDPLRIVGIVSTPPTASDYEARLRGGAIFDDVMRGSRSDAGTARVNEIRLIADAATSSVASYRSALGRDLEYAPQIRAIFQQALDDYRSLTGARRVVGFEFRRYLRNRPNSQFDAYQALDKLDTLFRHHRRSGLVAAEFTRIQLEWLVAIQPEGISLDELSQTVFPSRYVRGSDILDVFGE